MEPPAESSKKRRGDEQEVAAPAPIHNRYMDDASWYTVLQYVDPLLLLEMGDQARLLNWYVKRYPHYTCV